MERMAENHGMLANPTTTSRVLVTRMSVSSSPAVGDFKARLTWLNLRGFMCFVLENLPRIAFISVLPAHVVVVSSEPQVRP